MKQILIRLFMYSLVHFSICAKQLPTTTSPTTNGELSGKYINTLGSVMNLICTGSAGAAVLTGFYTSAVGDAEGNYPLLGQATSCNNDGQGGFSVAWLNEQNGNSFSATSWVFQAQQDGQRVVLNAPWIMVHETTKADAWSATNFGLDLFTKQEDIDGSDITERTTPPTVSK
jgi:hypothetical protein